MIGNPARLSRWGNRAAGALFLFFAACAGRPDPVQSFYRGQLDAAIDGFEARAAKRDKDFAQHSANLGSAALTAGYYDLANRAFEGASKVMFSLKGDELRGMLSLVSAESIKVWKGEPFEKAMAAFYLGLLYYMQGEYDNAAAGFRKALLANKQADEKHREEYAIAFYMLARCLVKQRDQQDLDGARLALEKAKRVYPGNAYFDLDRIKKSNLVLILETGRAPQKYRTGPGASLDDFREIDTPDVGAAAAIGGTQLGRAGQAFDLMVAAKHRGSSGKDVVQGTKGVLRDAGAVTTVIAADQAAHGNRTAGWVALGAGVFTLLNQSQADIRQWEVLPQRLAVLAAQVPPGVYDLRIDFLDSSGYKIAALSQVWNGVKISAEHDSLYLFRALPGQGGKIERVRPPKAQPQSAEEKKNEKSAG